MVRKPIQKQNEDKRNRMEDSRNKSTQIYPSNLTKDIKKAYIGENKSHQKKMVLGNSQMQKNETSSIFHTIQGGRERGRASKKLTKNE